MVKNIGRGRGRGDSSTDSSSDKTRIHKKKTEGSSDVSIPSDQRKDGREMFLKNAAIYQTRPQHIIQKSVPSSDGNHFFANYFRLQVSKGFEFLQYRVDITPEVDMIKLRRQIVAKSISGYVYDGGNLVYTTKHLPQEKLQSTVMIEDKTFMVKYRWTELTIKSTDTMAMMVLNCILRSAMRGLNLKLIQRNLFDDQAKIRINEYKLELWPGYITSIRQHEKDILVCCEISHKVMRFDTVYDIMQNYLRERDFKTAFSKEIIGTVVLTKYNNRTYHIDDVKYDMNPLSTFPTSQGPISFAEYYKNKYNIVIRDTQQPLLVSNPKVIFNIQKNTFS